MKIAVFTINTNPKEFFYNLLNDKNTLKFLQNLNFIKTGLNEVNQAIFFISGRTVSERKRELECGAADP